ncbi:family 43 glycosylhydrolase [Marinimicrobium alkaliphilum]|uniref:family 43 glycosylhydrolase n=1 Tax=Marinimicrobium alkaliphilum TaxID=2202654 RepID=UPI000DB9028A|nr:family 43 glycosylhydrolase [Marinimicrobium alkaliphilum]
MKKTKTTLASLRAGLIGLAAAVALTTGCATTGQPEQAADGAAAESTVERGVFTNPLFPNGADPWLEYWDGNYYLTTTTWTSELVMRKSPTLAGLATATPVNVWSDDHPDRNANFWAFEFHRVDGPNGVRWYVMYTAGRDGTLDYQHLNVLESVGDDPMGPYKYKAPIMPDVWNIDGTYLKHNDRLYLLYSQWQGDEQRNIIVEMDTPWSIKEDSPHTVVTKPELDWEMSGRKVTEAAQILQRDGRTFMIYSASYCNTPDYKLGMMELVGDDPLLAESWKKFPEPVFERGNGVYGPGHNGFFPSPDGTEDWLIYHGNSSVEHGCSATRSLRAQRFTWNDDGTPDFGEPLAEGVEVDPPSGEDGPLVTRIQGQFFHLVNASSGLCMDIASNPEQSHAIQNECRATNGQWVIDPVSDGYFRLANVHDSQFLEIANCSSANNAPARQAAWRNNECQEWSFEPGQDGHVEIVNRASGKPLAISGCSSARNQRVLQQDGESFCKDWTLQPVGDVAIMSEQSGRAVTVADCSTEDGANVRQDAWEYEACQTWQFSATDSGYFHLNPSHATDKCLAVDSESPVPGANLVSTDCDNITSQWSLDIREGGGSVLTNRYTNQVMDLAHCGVADKTNLAQGPDLDTRCQRFHLRSSN